MTAVIIPPLAVVLGAAFGAAIRNHRRWIIGTAVAAPVLATIALIVQFVPGGYESCQSTTAGADTCQALPAVDGWSPLAFAIAFGLIALSFAPVASAIRGAWWIAAASAVLQSIPQVISFGGFLDWAPALLATVAVAFAVAWSKPVVQSVSSPTV